MHESQQPSQQFRGAPGLTQDLGHLAALLPLERGVGQPVFGVGGDRHERIVHLVRDAGEQLARRGEAPLLLGPVTQHAGHRVEVLGQATELVGPTNRDADREIAVGDLGEAGLELVQRTPHAPAHHENQEGHQQRTQPEPQDRVASHLTGRGPQRPLARREICPSDPAAVGTALMGDPQELLDGHESRGRVRPATALELRHALLQDVADARQRAVDAHQGCPELLRGGGACRDPQRRAADRREVMHQPQRIRAGPRPAREVAHDGDRPVECAVAPREHRAHGGDGFGGGAERQSRSTDAKEQVDGKGGGVRSGGEGHGEQRHPHAEQAAGSHDQRSASLPNMEFIPRPRVHANMPMTTRLRYAPARR